MRTHCCDVAVIGGGPAGLSAGLALRQKSAQVTIFDADLRGPRLPRIETLQPQAKPLLSSIGAGHVLETGEAIAAPGVASHWSLPTPMEHSAILCPYGAPLHIERNAFKSALTALAGNAGVHIVSGPRAQARSTSSGWLVSNGRLAIIARFLIVATGRSPLPIPTTVARRRIDRLVAVVGTAVASGSRDLRLLIESECNGWWYWCPSVEGFVQAVFMSDVDLMRALAHAGPNWFAERLAHTELGSTLITKGFARVVAADTYCRDAVVGRDLIVIGDAAMAGDPLAGEGITVALRSGLRASEIATAPSETRAVALAEYSERLLFQFAHFLKTRSQIYESAVQWQKQAFWRRRSGS